MKIQKSGDRTGTKGTAVGHQRLGPYLVGNQTSGAVDFGVLTEDFHLEDRVGLLPSVHFGVGHESDQTFLKRAETALDLALGLGGGGHEMGDAQRLESALELTPGIPVVTARTGTKEAQRIGVDGLWHTARLEGLAEVTKVVPCGVGRDEATGDIEAGMVVDGK